MSLYNRSRLRRWLVLSASTITLSVAGDALAQDANAPQAPVAAPAPQQPVDAPTSQPPAAAPQQPSASPPAASDGANVLPETRIVAPVRRARPPARPQPVVAAQPSPPSAAQVVSQQNDSFDTARKNLLAPVGTVPYEMTQKAIQAKPQGANASLDKVLLQAPGVTQDSAASGELHVRNEHGNVQYRINGIALPDGVGSFGQILDTGIVGSLALITGALPAQFGLRTAGVVDIQTSQAAFDNSGQISVYGGSHGIVTPSIEYGGTAGKTQYFLSGRYYGSDIGLENPTAARSAIHDHTDQGKGFAYLSTIIDPEARLVFMSGASARRYQIPNNPGQAPQFTAFGVSNFDSAALNERQNEFTQFDVLAVQHSAQGVDIQAAYFNRTSTVHFMPDTVGDLSFNGVASDVYRRSVVNGIQTDASYRWGDAHTLRTGFTVSTERSMVNNSSVLLPLDDQGNPPDAPFGGIDSSKKTGWLFGSYLQDEWKITNQLTLNTGLRFDQMWQYSNANQLSPRLSLTWTPFDGTVFHAGYARYFTPPPQVLAAPVNLALVQNTTQQPEVNLADPVKPERSHYFDVGITQRLMPGLDVGVDAYYKNARNLLDDGQFGAAYVLTAFNYDKAENIGVELKANYVDGNFRAYGNIAIARQLGTTVSSNQFLFGAAELAFIASNYVYTDHSQLVSGSAGASYLWNGTRFSADMIFGSGLRSGFANTDSLPWYDQYNLGISHEFKWPGTPMKPTTLRFDIVNVFDRVYQIRDGSGIGVFAPQYGPRRGFFAGISQKF
jgi:outer membrane receptor protein involved in Fe transport